jgi:hypothetical protein
VLVRKQATSWTIDVAPRLVVSGAGTGTAAPTDVVNTFQN